jgi:hypothetical protein
MSPVGLFICSGICMSRKAGAAMVLILSLAVFGACSLLALLTAIPSALSHSWYPHRCCGGHDCARVESIERLPDGDLLFRAGSISVVVPAEFMRLPSPDNDTHVCVYRVGSGEYRPRCVFVPGII